jgi:lipopolysaccharide/colanic/teichoic acid biosynthesis glycosyltransferase
MQHVSTTSSHRIQGLDRALATRALDLCVGSVAALLSLPVVFLLLMGSAVVFRANPLFVQHRIGRHGRLIPIPKVRSLSPLTPADADKYGLNSWNVTRWGRFIRRLHIDELPQLWMVVAGRMSLVGPRPEIPRLAEQFTPEFAATRHSVRPGLTGLWQISEGADGLISEAPEWDRIYVRNACARLDIWILFRTVRHYLPGGRPIRVADLPSWVQVSVEDADAPSMSESGVE